MLGHVVKIVHRFLHRKKIELCDFCFGMRVVYSLAWKYDYKNNIILLITCNMGDSLYGLSCLDAYKQENPKMSVTIIGKEEHRSILETYSQIDKFVFISDKSDVDMFMRFIRLKRFWKIGKKYNIFQTNPWYWGKETCQDRDVISLLQTQLFDLSPNDIITYPRLPLVQVDAIKNFERDCNYIVVLNPYSYSRGTGNDELFKKICAILRQMGYIVYTNVVADQTAIEGSFELRCSVFELYSIAMKIPYIISIRSGILDLLVNTSIKIIALYEEFDVNDELFKNLYTLKGWRKGNIHEIFSVNNTENTLFEIKEILEYDNDIVNSN